MWSARILGGEGVRKKLVGFGDLGLLAQRAARRERKACRVRRFGFVGAAGDTTGAKKLLGFGDYDH